MILEYGPQSNCSEATIHIDLRGQDKKKIKELINKLELEFHNDIGEVKDWDDEKGKEFELSEGYVSEKSIFGTKLLVIQGDAPYNYPDEIEEIINRYLPKAKREWAE